MGIEEEYFRWICQLVGGRRRRSHQALLAYLRDRPFTYILDLDGNRESDGIDLRYRFGQERGIDSRIIARSLDSRPCGVLEMMAALAVRCEEHIMGDPEAGDRTAKWFWTMLDNLGLGSMTDREFNRERADTIVERFLNREYGPDGRGGPFPLRECRFDLRAVEIWYQAMWYLSETMKGGKGG